MEERGCRQSLEQPWEAGLGADEERLERRSISRPEQNLREKVRVEEKSVTLLAEGMAVLLGTCGVGGFSEVLDPQSCLTHGPALSPGCPNTCIPPAGVRARSQMVWESGNTRTDTSRAICIYAAFPGLIRSCESSSLCSPDGAWPVPPLKGTAVTDQIVPYCQQLSGSAEKKGWEGMDKSTKSTCLLIVTLEESDGDTGGSKAILQGKDGRTNTIRLLRAPANLSLNVSRDGASTTSLGNLGQCFTTLIVKSVFLISSLNLPSFSLKPLPLVLSQQALLKILEGCNKVSPEPSLLQAEQPQLSQPFFRGEVFHPSDHFCGPPLDPLQEVHVFPVLRAPELDAVLQVGSDQSRVEGQNHLPRPDGHAALDAAQGTVGILGCEHTLPAHVQLFIHQYPQPILIVGLALTQVQDPALGLVEPHEVHTGPLLKLVQVPLNGIPSLRRVNCTTQLGVICKPAECALDPTVCVIDEDIKQY
ncbi:hypothetical protein QYF61_003039 [Mycteria americana]|uniref:Uncharacterized protein n=1 Tax=Mycteria americana TaxID=33587 RepID=A0AAN7NCX4_MYCAM|nr:hypothetical protein QYF61_003039 [Mycteria americana]